MRTFLSVWPLLRKIGVEYLLIIWPWCVILVGKINAKPLLGEGREEIHLQRAVATAQVCVISK